MDSTACRPYSDTSYDIAITVDQQCSVDI